MNRREAIAALIALPSTATVTVAQMKPDDVIVFESSVPLDRETIAEIHERAQIAFPGRKVVVVDHGLKLKIVSNQR